MPTQITHSSTNIDSTTLLRILDIGSPSTEAKAKDTREALQKGNREKCSGWTLFDLINLLFALCMYLACFDGA